MTLPNHEDRTKILKFCATTPKSAPSPPLRRGQVYCLSSFTKRAEQWFKEEAGRQLEQRIREEAVTDTRVRRQPSRAAKKGFSFEPSDYVLHQDELKSLLWCLTQPPPAKESQQPPLDSKANDRKTTTGHETRWRPATPPPDNETEDQDTDTPQGEPVDYSSPQGLNSWLGDFRARLVTTIHTKEQDLRAQHDKEGGVRHTCAAAGEGSWDCVDEEYCGHGLVDRCVRWVPKTKPHLRSRVRYEMEGFFSSASSITGSNPGGSVVLRVNNNHPERLAELKKGRAAALRAETIRRMADIEERLLSAGGEAAAEAEMLESPTLGRWPVGSEGFPREDVTAQRVELVGLAFAVDVCVGDTRILML